MHDNLLHATFLELYLIPLYIPVVELVVFVVTTSVLETTERVFRTPSGGMVDVATLDPILPATSLSAYLLEYNHQSHVSSLRALWPVGIDKLDWMCPVAALYLPVRLWISPLNPHNLSAWASGTMLSLFKLMPLLAPIVAVETPTYLDSSNTIFARSLLKPGAKILIPAVHYPVWPANHLPPFYPIVVVSSRSLPEVDLVVYMFPLSPSPRILSGQTLLRPACFYSVASLTVP